MIRVASNHQNVLPVPALTLSFPIRMHHKRIARKKSRSNDAIRIVFYHCEIVRPRYTAQRNYCTKHKVRRPWKRCWCDKHRRQWNISYYIRPKKTIAMVVQPHRAFPINFPVFIVAVTLTLIHFAVTNVELGINLSNMYPNLE